MLTSAVALLSSYPTSVLVGKGNPRVYIYSSENELELLLKLDSLELVEAVAVTLIPHPPPEAEKLADWVVVSFEVERDVRNLVLVTKREP